MLSLQLQTWTTSKQALSQPSPSWCPPDVFNFNSNGGLEFWELKSFTSGTHWARQGYCKIAGAGVGRGSPWFLFPKDVNHKMYPILLRVPCQNIRSSDQIYNHIVFIVVERWSFPALSSKASIPTSTNVITTKPCVMMLQYRLHPFRRSSQHCRPIHKGRHWSKRQRVSPVPQEFLCVLLNIFCNSPLLM